MGKRRKIGSWHKLNKLTKAVKLTNFKTSFLFSSLAVGYLASAVTIGYFSSSIFTDLLNDDQFVQYDIKDVRDNFPVFIIDGKHVPIYDSEESLRMEFLNKEIEKEFKKFILNSKFSGFLKYLIDRNPDNYKVLGLYKDFKTTQPIDVDDLQHNQISKNIIFMKFSVSGKEQKIPIPAAISIINTEVFLKKFFEFKMLKATQWPKVDSVKNDIFYRQAGYLPYQYFASSSTASSSVTNDLYRKINENFKKFITNEKQEFGKKDQTIDQIIQQLKYSLQIFKGEKPLNDEFITTKVQTADSNADKMAQQIVENKLDVNQPLKEESDKKVKFSIGFMPNDFDVDQFKKDAAQLFSSNSVSAANFEYLDVYNKYPILPFVSIYGDKVKDKTNTLNYDATKVKWNDILNNNYANNFVIDDFQFSSSGDAKLDFDNLKNNILFKLWDKSNDYHRFIAATDVINKNRFKQILQREELRFLGGITSITFYDQYHRESWELSEKDITEDWIKFKKNYNLIKTNLAIIKSISYTIGAPGLKRKIGVVDATGAEYRDIYNYAQTFFNKAKFK